MHFRNIWTGLRDPKLGQGSFSHLHVANSAIFEDRGDFRWNERAVSQLSHARARALERSVARYGTFFAQSVHDQISVHSSP